MKISSTQIVDSFAEAFVMKYTRLIVTAIDDYWLDVATREFSGYGTSVIGCDAEVGVESALDPQATPDGRAGRSLMVFGFSSDALGKAVVNRVGQCLMTCPTTAVFDGLPESEKAIGLGKSLRLFGDGYQKSKLLGERRFWRIPVMDGEFVAEERLGIASGVAGGNFLIQSNDQVSGLAAARRAVAAISSVVGAITPFPAGVVRSGSKVGSKYKPLRASTSEAYCPTLRGQVDSKVVDGANCVYEIVIDGESEKAIETAMKLGIEASIHGSEAGEILAIDAGNYGGELGKYHFKLHDLFADSLT